MLGVCWFLVYAFISFVFVYVCCFVCGLFVVQALFVVVCCFVVVLFPCLFVCV